MKTTRVKVSPNTKAKLQKEINSECPFCSNNEVGCFEIHHIDGNKTNNDYMNLLMLCPTCHAKIEKGEITTEEVVKMKKELQLSNGKIEFVAVVVENSICKWEVSLVNEHAFFKKENNNKSDHPILNFSFINHLSKTVVLKTIEVKVKELQRGLSGIGPEPTVLKPLIKYHLALKYGNDVHVLHLQNPILVPTTKGFLFQIELFMSDRDENIYPIDGRLATYFTFHFSGGIKVKPPTICFNCNNENEPIKIYKLN